MIRAHVSRRTALTALGTAALGTAAAALSGCATNASASADPTPTPASPSAASSPSPTAAPSPTASASASASASVSPSVAPSGTTTTATLRIGDSGDAVSQMQQQVSSLGYWLGAIDGKFGGTTQQAVWAVQKAAGISRTGRVDAATWAAIGRGVRPSAKSTSGTLIEVDLARDLLLIIQDGKLAWILNTSTGGGYTYVSEGVRSVAITPKGHYKTYRVIEGVHTAPLGVLISPRFFTGGYAIHGEDSVPPYPASHGCVRVSDSAIAWIWSANLDPIGSTVWIY